jgi:hypothetical protein
MAIYIANANGDWWEYRVGETLHILNTDDLPAEEKEDWETYRDMNATWICEYGTEIVHDITMPEPPKAWYTDKELEEEVDEFIQAELDEAYDETIEEVSEELGISKETLRDSLAVDEIINSYIQDNITYGQMINKINSRMSHPSAQGETF